MTRVTPSLLQLESNMKVYVVMVNASGKRRMTTMILMMRYKVPMIRLMQTMPWLLIVHHPRLTCRTRNQLNVLLALLTVLPLRGKGNEDSMEQSILV